MDFGTCHKVYSVWTVANGLWHFIRPTACVDCDACHKVYSMWVVAHVVRLTV